MAEYERGMRDAWEVARKIEGDLDSDGLNETELFTLFGVHDAGLVFRYFSCDDVMKKLKEHSRIKVGDEVTDGDEKMIVVYVDETNVNVFTGHGGIRGYGIEQVYKTGKSYPEIKTIMKGMIDSER